MPALILLLLLLAGTTQGSEIGLVRIGEPWKVYRGISEPAGAAGDWTKINYTQELLWPVMSSSLSTPAFHPETTVIYDYGANYSTIYFRNDFLLADPAAVEELILRIDYDDGFVAYLNGSEIARRGIAASLEGWIPSNAFATPHTRGYTEEINVSAHFPKLVSGKNVLAIQVLGSGLPDYTFCMVSELLANFTRGPFLQSTTSNSVQIVSKTFSPAIGFVDYTLKENPVAQRLMVDLAPGTNHVALLTGLTPGSKYRYRIGALLNERVVLSDWSEFSTLRTEGPARFMVLGDSGWATSAQLRIANQLLKPEADLLMHVGDVVYYGYSHFAEDFRMFSVYEQLMKRTPVFIALGNHDFLYDRVSILESFYLPTNSITGSELYYSFDHGDVHFVALWADLQHGAQYFPGSPFYQWLENDLKTTTKPWKFFFFHHTLRTSGPHAFDDYDLNSVLDSVQLQAGIGVLAEKYGVQIIFNGHDHNYERFVPVNGTVSFVSGGGGASLYGLNWYQTNSVHYQSRHNFLSVEVEGNVAKVDAIGDDGQVFDTVHIQRTLPEKKLYQSEWHTPKMETAPSNDGDANVSNQRFSFKGSPIPSKMGLNSMAGRLYVNNDGRNLYLGLDEAGISKEQNIFLFIGSSSVPGVNSMAGVGNGLVDPGGEGADGLDFLENVSFKNFAPKVGVILGDEAADGLAPGFKRQEMSLAAGQGAFYLGPQLLPVFGQQIQQYNRSPQEFPFVYEQNANFIELSIPYRSLGLAPGQTIQVAVVAGLGFTNTPPEVGSRTIDLAGVVSSITIENDRTIIEPVEIKLATGDFVLQGESMPGGKFKLFWFSLPGKKYRILTTDNIVVPFQELAGQPVLTATEQETSVELNSAGAPRFFRIVEAP